MSETEKHYAQIEKEELATVWVCDKFASYNYWTQVFIETDHKPLMPLLGTKKLDSLPPSILRFLLRLARFDYTIQYVPGKLLCTPQALSRAPGPSTKAKKKLNILWRYASIISEPAVNGCVNTLVLSCISIVHSNNGLLSKWMAGGTQN